MSEKEILESELVVDGELSFYEGKPFTGVCVLYFVPESEYEKIEKNYKDGKQHGLDTKFFKNGNKESEINFLSGKMEGRVNKWDEKGNNVFSANYKNGELDGNFKEYWEGGQLNYEENYTNGVLNGVRK